MSAIPLSRVAVQLRPEDNVAVAARHLQPGTEVLPICSTVIPGSEALMHSFTRAATSVAEGSYSSQ